MIFKILVAVLFLFIHYWSARAEVPLEQIYRNVANRTRYDYVIVGGGSAGATLANGLSENGKFTVLLLEAGGLPPPMSEVPISVNDLLLSEIEWNNYSEPQDNACLASPERKCIWHRAKVLGGCSVHNQMLYGRGNKKDFDIWEEMGAKGWNYESVLQVFKKVEDCHIQEFQNNGYHGTGGYLTVSPLSYRTRIGEAFLEAGRFLGYNSVDYNGPSQLGISPAQVTQRDGLRCSTEKAFLRPVASRENLDILIRAFVHKVTFDDQKMVKTVVFDHDNETKEVEISKEVILSAGTLSSPKILMLSGIGPKEHLIEMKIPVVVDLPGVGQNLQDHPLFPHLNFVINESAGIVLKRDINLETIGQLLYKRGPLTSPGLVEDLAFVNTECPKCVEDTPDMSFLIGPSSMFTPYPMDLTTVNTTGILPMLLRPKSRGVLKLRSSNPYDDPSVDPRYFSHPDDMKKSIAGIKIALSLMETPALQRFSPKITPEVLQGCENFDTESDEYIECALRRYIMAGSHFVGTCKMGDPDDELSVLDPELRVKGVTGLRVADASVMPYITTGYLNAPCIMIGQKAADMILTSA